MLKKFKKLIERTFLFCPNSKEVKETKEELLGTLMDKYTELTQGGMSEEEAYAQCVAEAEGYRAIMKGMLNAKAIKIKDFINKSNIRLITSGIFAFVMAVALIYFIISVTGLVSWNWSWLTFVGGAVVGLATLAGLFTFKAFRTSKFLLVRCSSALMITLLTTTVYLIVSLVLKDAWNITWLAFICGAIAAYLVDMAYTFKMGIKRLYSLDILILTLLATIVIYFVISFTQNAWDTTWMLYIVWLFVASFAIFTYRFIKYRKAKDAADGQTAITDDNLQCLNDEQEEQKDAKDTVKIEKKNNSD